MGVDMDLSSLPFRNFSRYRLLLHGFLHLLKNLFQYRFLLGSPPLYMLINYFSTMVYTPIHSFEARPGGRPGDLVDPAANQLTFIFFISFTKLMSF